MSDNATAEQINRAIHEWLGECPHGDTPAWAFGECSTCGTTLRMGWDEMPDYTASLDAIRVAEEKAVRDFKVKYRWGFTIELMQILGIELAETLSPNDIQRMVLATADQRARAIYSLIQSQPVAAEEEK